MRNLGSAIIEWLQLRARLREERRFHLDCAAAELRDSGLTAREAKRAARLRYGHKTRKLAARELGCDLAGLAYLIRTGRVLASPWLAPAGLLCAIALLFLSAPRPRELAGNIVIRLHRVETRRVILTPDVGSIWRAGNITGQEFDALQSLTTLTHVERYRGSYAWGQVAPGVTLDAIVSEALRATGNPRLVAEFVPPHWELLANPAQSVWLVIACYGAFLLLCSAPPFLWRWLLYGIGTAALHAAASLALAAFTPQIFVIACTPVLAILVIVWLGLAALQCRYWWIGLRSRCPLCLKPMVLPLTEGVEGSMILHPAVTESICAHGHGVLVESRWSRRFRREESPLESLAIFS
ncbi:MAG TPA: hypothetical protein VHC90_13960 [Bryobacteraceae bacterium]|nr:hypothetical protein [Bryobacteraceae bacterium]